MFLVYARSHIRWVCGVVALAGRELSSLHLT